MLSKYCKTFVLLVSTAIIMILFSYQINSNIIKSFFFKKIYAQKKTETQLEYFKRIKKTDKQIKYDKYTNIGVGILHMAPFVISIVSTNPIMYTTYASAIIISTPVVAFGKKIFKEPRPDDKNDLTSFPSGHSMFAFMCLTVVIISIKRRKYVYIIGPILTIISLFVAIGRVIANRHWPIDVICGSTLGVMAGIVAFLLIKKINGKLSLFKN